MEGIELSGMPLKPCPFCGGKADVAQSGTGANREFVNFKFEIRCSKCGITLRNMTGLIEMTLKDGKIHIVRDDRKNIARMWNRRYADDEQNQ